jgi:hypothetical protein
MHDADLHRCRQAIDDDTKGELKLFLLSQLLAANFELFKFGG